MVVSPPGGRRVSALLSQVQAVHRTLRAIRVGRRVLLSVAAALLPVVIVFGVRGPTHAVSWVVVAVAGPAMAVTAWSLLARRDPGGALAAHEALARSALWMEEQAVAGHGRPDFTLTTAIELLVAGSSIPAALSAAAARAVQPAVLAAALRRERQRAWRWPIVFVGLCAALLAVRWWSHDRERARPLAAGLAAPVDVRPATTAVAPLGPWAVRVQPPSYAAIPARAYHDVNTVAALDGSTIAVSGDGSVPTVEASAAGRVTRVDAVRDGAGPWRFTLRAGRGVQTARVMRGGRTRLLIVEGRSDSVPRVSLERPARDSVFREPRGVLPLAASAFDDIGLTRAHFELIVTSGEGERFTVRTVRIGERAWAGRTAPRAVALRGELDLAALGLEAGDVVHLRAVARDAHPSATREFGSSETRAFRIARAAEYDSVAVEPAPPPEVDTSLLSQRMLLMLTEKLVRAQRRLTRPDVLRESVRLARDQARLRLAVGEVVFQRLSGESSAEHAHTPGDGHDHGVDVQGGKLSMRTSSTTGMLEEGNDAPVVAINQPLLEAYNAMWDAGRALEQGAPHAAIPPMKRALEAIERSRAASRLYLRGRPPQVIVDIAKVRLTGKDTGQVTVRSARAARDATSAPRDLRLVRAAALIGTDGQAARDSVALLRVEALADEPAFAAALTQLLSRLEQGGDATGAFLAARRVLGNVVRTRATVWSRGVTP
jgi:hypothetical protein